MRKMFAAAAILAGALVSTAAWAGRQDFTIVNHTGHTIVTLNVSASDETNWGPDILGREVLANDESTEVTFDRAEGRCNWDVRVTYDDGDTNDLRQVNLCETTTLTFTA